MKYVNEDALRDVLEGFETGTIAREDWGHPEHLIVAYFYCLEGDAESACRRMKNGILKLLDSFGIDREKEMPYHETMTTFWIRSVRGFVLERPDLAAVEACTALITKFGKDHPLEYYSRELLFSDRARAEFVEPDLKPFMKTDSALVTQG